MSDDDSVVCVDKDGNPVVDEGRPTNTVSISMPNVARNSLETSYATGTTGTVIVIDDDSSVETTLVIGTSLGRKKLKEDVMMGMDDEVEKNDNDGGSDESPFRPQKSEKGVEDGSENPVRLTASAIAENCERIAQGHVFGPKVSHGTSGNGSVASEGPGDKNAGMNCSMEDTSSSEGAENNTSSLRCKESLNNIIMSADSPKNSSIPRKLDGVEHASDDDLSTMRKRRYNDEMLGYLSWPIPENVKTDSEFLLPRGRLRSWYGLGRIAGPEVASLPQKSTTVTPAAERQVCEDSSSDKGILKEWNKRAIYKNNLRAANQSGDMVRDAEKIHVGISSSSGASDWLSSDVREGSVSGDESNHSISERSIKGDESNHSITQNKVASPDDQDPWKTYAPKLNPRPPFKTDETTKVTSSLCIRSRVYAKWTNGEYFWGSITAISGDYYSIFFDDGDFLERVPKKNFETEAYMEAALGETPPPLDRKTAKLVDDLISGKVSMSDVKLPNSARKLTVAGTKGICGCCENCRKEPCGRCAWCRSDGNRCLQKMCCAMPVDAKAEPAVGFPQGWRFLFNEARQSLPTSKHEAIPCLSIVSPGGRTFRSVEAAVSFIKLQNGEMVAHAFYDHVGLSHKGKRTLPMRLSKRSRVDEVEKVAESRPRKKQSAKQSCTGQTKTSTNHLLVGRNFCLKWMDLTKHRKVIYGQVAEYEYNTQKRDIISFKVTFNDEMRQVLNRIGNGCGSKIHSFESFDPLWTWGGCVLAEQELQQGASSDRACLMRRLPTIYYSWLTPDVSIQSMAKSGGTQFPRLVIFYRCCRLQFDVKPSRIPSGGQGVFLSCTRDDAKTDSFKLKNGELLDLGIYAPLRIEDLGLKAIFLVKNFIHDYKIEDYAFSHTDHRYHIDISDDISGDLHTGAKSQIFPFVNESFDNLCVTVRPTPDPEGFLHYHLGHSTKEQGDFEVPTDGSEIELYANYGPEYEKVRIRKGYSKLSEENQAGVLELQDAGYLEAMDEFEESDVMPCVDFLSKLLSTTRSEIAPEVKQRALTCAVVLQRRAWHLLLDNNSDEGNMTKVWQNARDLVALLLRNDELEELHSQDKCEEVMKRVFERHAFSEEAWNEVAYMLE